MRLNGVVSISTYICLPFLLDHQMKFLSRRESFCTRSDAYAHLRSRSMLAQFDPRVQTAMLPTCVTRDPNSNSVFMAVIWAMLCITTVLIGGIDGIQHVNDNTCVSKIYPRHVSG